MGRDRVNRLFRHVRNANLRYNLIASGDHIAAGISGGKDSLTMLFALRLLLDYTPLDFKVTGITLDLGLGQDFSATAEYTRSLGFDYHLVSTGISRAVLGDNRNQNPCALCSHLRRGALNKHALELGCNKVALAHNLDDVVTTVFMSAFYNSRFQAFTPSTYLSETGLTVIRPLIYAEQELIRRLAADHGMPVVANPCPAAGNTARSRVEEWLLATERQFPHARRRLLNAWEHLENKNLVPDSEHLFEN